jgi:hypothetical protein
MCELYYLVLQFHHSTDLILLFFSDFQQCSLKYQYSGSDKHQIPVEVYGRNQLSFSIGKNTTPICSTLELCKVIAKLNISMPSSSRCLDEDILQTLSNDYKSNFNEDVNGIKSAGSNASFKENIDGFYMKTTQKGGFSKLCVKIKKRYYTDLLHRVNIGFFTGFKKIKQRRMIL